MTMLGDKQGSFQLVLSTDGKNSFASFVYSDPETIFSNVLEPELDEDYPLIEVEASIGFDGGEGTLGADFGLFLKRNNRPLTAVNTFRIDGNIKYRATIDIEFFLTQRQLKVASFIYSTLRYT